MAEATVEHRGKMAPAPVAASEAHLRYLADLKRRRQLVAIGRTTIFVLLMLAWELGARFGWINPFIFSSPSQVVALLWRMVADGSIWRHLGWTVTETAIGFTLGTLLGTVIAIALWWSKGLAETLDPYLVVLNSIPKVALGPIFIVWMGTGMRAIIAMALAISVIVTVLMVFTGFQEVDPDKVKLLRTFGATKGQILRLVVLPASVPTIIAALKVSVGQSLVGVIMGEFLVSQAGLGYLIVYGGQVWKMNLILGSLSVLCLVSIALYYGVSWLERRYLRWRS